LWPNTETDESDPDYLAEDIDKDVLDEYGVFCNAKWENKMPTKYLPNLGRYSFQFKWPPFPFRAG
jgi:hypothetical protein